jgi:thiamine-monophosphate kinase
MIDTSDGLVQDLGHVAAASGVAIDLDTARLRPGPELAAAARALERAANSAGGSAAAGSPAAQRGSAAAQWGSAAAQWGSAAAELGPAASAPGLGWVLSGGEDHALAATFPRNIALPSHWTVIGEVREGHGVRVDGMNYQGQAGWQHFR